MRRCRGDCVGLDHRSVFDSCLGKFPIGPIVSKMDRFFTLSPIMEVEHYPKLKGNWYWRHTHVPLNHDCGRKSNMEFWYLIFPDFAETSQDSWFGVEGSRMESWIFVYRQRMFFGWWVWYIGTKNHQTWKSMSCFLRSFHLSKVQNPYDIPLYWLVHKDPYNGWVALDIQTPPKKVGVDPKKIPSKHRSPQEVWLDV